MLPRVARSENSPRRKLKVKLHQTRRPDVGGRLEQHLMNFLNFAKRFDVERQQIECLRDDSRVTGFIAFSSVLFYGRIIKMIRDDFSAEHLHNLDHRWMHRRAAAIYKRLLAQK